MAGSNRVDLLLIGKTGNGKSATGNSILRRKAFKSRASSTSVTSTVDSEVSEFKGRIIKVVDGPGVGDNRMNTEGAVNLVMRTMAYAISANPLGYHAFLLLVRFGARFTAEEQDTILFLKRVFGEDFVKKFCILVLTCGDSFEHEKEERGISFEEWCDEQQLDFKNLLSECDNRVVLFDNVTKDIDKKNKQIETLLKIVDNLSSKGQRYTDENFELANKERNRVIVELKRSVIQEDTMQETSLILMQLQKIQEIEDLKTRKKPLEDLQIRAEALQFKLASIDQATGALSDLIATVKSIRSNINDEIKFCYKMEDEMEKVRRREENIRKEYEEEMKILKEKHERKAKVDERVLEEHRKFAKEQARLQREMEERSEKERKEMEKKLKAENEKLKKQHEEAEDKYRNLRQENERGISGKIFDAVKWPFKKIGGWFS